MGHPATSSPGWSARRPIVDENAAAQAQDGWDRPPAAIASQIRHAIRAMQTIRPTWMRRAPVTLRDADEFAAELRTNARETGRILGVVISAEAALALDDLLEETARLRASHAIAKKNFLGEAEVS